MYCNYYQAKTLRKKTWFVFGALRNEENITFGRTIDAKNSIVEFFVTPECEEHFLKIMNYLKKNGYILSLEKLPNRLKQNA